MKQVFISFLLLFIWTGSFSQQNLKKVDETAFFLNDSVIEAEIKLDFRHLVNNKHREGNKYKAQFTARLDDDFQVSEPVTIEVRGKFRRRTCYLPPMKINFKHPNSPLSSLGSLKLVNVCETGKEEFQDFLLKEYLTYKLYNFITDKSLRVRLLRIKFTDSAGKRKPLTEYAFLLEDVKDMARRNGCVEKKARVKHTEETHRQQMTRVALFEYMIANTDWSVPAQHNIKLIVSKDDTTAMPYPVPYDFDHSGLVHTSYALPPPHLDIKDVTVRSYRGFARQMEELQEVADEFLQKKDSMIALINGFDLLPQRIRKDMIYFLEQFFRIISQPREIRTEFIINARRN